MSTTIKIITLNPNLVKSDIIETKTSSQTFKQAIMIRCIFISVHYLFYKGISMKKTKNDGQFNGLALVYK